MNQPPDAGGPPGSWPSPPWDAPSRPWAGPNTPQPGPGSPPVQHLGQQPGLHPGQHPGLLAGPHAELQGTEPAPGRRGLRRDSGQQGLLGAMPRGRVVAIALTGALLAGGATGAAMTLLAGPAGTSRTVAADPSGTPSEGTDPATGAASATGSVKPTSSPSAKRSAAAPSPAPANLVASPWTDPKLELASLMSVTRGDDGSTVITVDRLTFLTGAKARAYYAKHPDQQPDDFAIENVNPKIYTFTLAPGTPIYLSTMAGSPGNPIAADAARLASGFAQAGGGPVYVWLRDDGKNKGWVTYLAEQSLP